MSMEVSGSKEYKKVLEHRKKCPKWTKGFCLECFGNGLNVFVENLMKEKIISFIEQ